ncbi:pentatricopeptide repeat-containing protein At3g46790, chloroplastic [Selaginella moellendorffii]|uniref:pentatricopeptide repeat-containing protein At3g46790, chloroplastic n=1 Tax=Selaginella moellendorffii TaxID=88036 RepID=UPI000D1CAB01|nr:pentatricopeptide repeat-containing protein At3g46790, chloroplastic [Selaginella moellendorffii]|eukprot:XP_024536329.1 pentatricopeptide repeat-containing protein At3g46790, chloroplastic [Selaginella moellendorffii]
MDLFRRMQLSGVSADRLVIASVLESLAALGLADPSIRSAAAPIREWIFLSGLERDPYLRTGLIAMYGKWGLLHESMAIFFRESSLDSNVVAWTAMVSSCSQHGRVDLAVALFHRMNLEGVRQDRVSMMTIMDALASDPSHCPRNLAAIDEAIASCGLESSTAIGNSLINLHAKSGRIERALEIFHGMIHRDVISWGSIITALAQSGNGAGVLAMLREMDFEGIKPDAVVFVSAIDACKSSSRLADGRILHARAIASGVHDRIQVANSLLDMYSKCGRLDLAMAVFLALPQRDTIAWNSIVISFAQHGDWIRARELFQAMHLEGMEPSRVTIVSILSACRHAGLLEEARRYFVCMADDHGIDPALLHYGSMIDLFGRAGWLDHAEELVREMPIQPAITSVTALLGSCRIHGDARRASGAAEQAIDLNPESAAGGLALLSNTFAGNA